MSCTLMYFGVSVVCLPIWQKPLQGHNAANSLNRR